MEVVDGFRDRTKNVESVTNELFLELFPVGFRGIEEGGTEVTQVTEGSGESTLSSSDGRSDLLGECYNTTRDR